MKRFNATIAYIAAYAARLIGKQAAGDKDPEPAGKKVVGKHYRKRTHVFGESPPYGPDPGGVHAYMRRHRT